MNTNDARSRTGCGLGPALVALTAFLLTACGQDSPVGGAGPGSPDAQEAATVVRIGHVAPLTGPVAHLGRDSDNGVRLAIEDANAQRIRIDGKLVRFELLSEDDQFDAKVGVMVANRLVDAKIAGVVGHLNSGTTIPASRVYFTAGIPQISPSATNPLYTQQGFSTAFRVIANDVRQGSVIGNYVVEQLGLTRMALVDDRTAYGRGFADEVEKAVRAAGGNVVAREFTNDKASDFTAILKNIKAAQPDIVFLGGMDSTAGPFLKQMKLLGMDAKFISGDASCSPEIIKLAGDASEGIYCTRPGLPIDQLPNGRRFVAELVKRHGQVQVYSPYAYDATMVLIDAMKRAGSVEPAKYLPEVAKTKYEGVTGRIEFDAKGDVLNSAITVYHVSGGALEVVSISGARNRQGK